MINQNEHTLSDSNKDASFVEWKNCAEINPNDLAFDHREIYYMALNRLRTKVQYEPIGFNLLPEWFTLTELYDMYRIILQKDFDRRNFTRKVMSYGLIKKTEHKTGGHVGRKGQLYEFDLKRYTELAKTGIYFEI